ncbi:MAG: hypothetical protein JWM25_139, partial [Thermoleophilia bacterium]|nr:hypothetical protein [Thermoleophilia bacterium]
MSRTIFHAALALTIAAIGALAVPAASFAFLVGAEANGELINSDRTPEQQAFALDKLKAQGVQIVRANISWRETAANCAGETALALQEHTNPCYSWGVIDNLVRLSTERKIQLLVSSSRVPAWLHPGQEDPYFVGSFTVDFDKTNEHYAAFVRAAASRYKAGSEYGTIQRWTIWNEPNSVTFWKPTPNATRYAQMYGKAAVALKAGNPAALVAPGPTGPNSTIKPVTFITAFQAQVVKFLPKVNARKYINAWAHNPYPNNYSPNGHAKTKRSYVTATSLGMAETPKLIALLDAKPITKKLPIWGTEFGWETTPDDPRPFWKRQTVSRAVQAQYLADGFAYLARNPRVALGIYYGLTDNTNYEGDWQSGTFGANGIAKPSHYSYQRM